MINEIANPVLRPVRFQYLVNILDEELADMWDKGKALSGLVGVIKLHSDLPKFFRRIDAIDYIVPGTPQGWKEIKITLTGGNALQGVVERSKIVSLYIRILEGLTELMKSSSNAECKLCYFGPMERYIPPEPENMVPISMFNPVMKKA